MPRLPSKHTLCTRLALTDDEGRKLRRLLEAHESDEYLGATLGNISDLLRAAGVAYIPSRQDTPSRGWGLEYVDTGSSHAQTIIYDRRTTRFLCDAWDRLVAIQPSRFSSMEPSQRMRLVRFRPYQHAPTFSLELYDEGSAWVIG